MKKLLLLGLLFAGIAQATLPPSMTCDNGMSFRNGGAVIDLPDGGGTTAWVTQTRLDHWTLDAGSLGRYSLWRDAKSVKGLNPTADPTIWTHSFWNAPAPREVCHDEWQGGVSGSYRRLCSMVKGWPTKIANCKAAGG